jgi:hypothetical protein
LTPLAHRVSALVEQFVPANLRDEGGEDATRSRSAIGFAFLASPVFVVLALLRVATRRWVIVCVDSVLAATMIAFPFVRKRRPELVARMVFMTGGTFTDRTLEFRRSVRNDFLQKPIDIRALTALLDGLPEPLALVAKRPVECAV